MCLVSHGPFSALGDEGMLDTQQQLSVKKRDGRILLFEQRLIQNAIQKAFCAEKGLKDVSQLDDAYLSKIDLITEAVVDVVKAEAAEDGISVEQIQDTVERQLMKADFYAVARRYILYRAQRAKVRQLRADERMESSDAFPNDGQSRWKARGS